LRIQLKRYRSRRYSERASQDSQFPNFLIKEIETMHEKEIEVKLQKLPEDLRREVLNYMEFLLKKYKGTESKAKKFRFDWEGGLSEIRGKFTSVELQHKALEWR
jgi:hypothetical protein